MDVYGMDTNEIQDVALVRLSCLINSSNRVSRCIIKQGFLCWGKRCGVIPLVSRQKESFPYSILIQNIIGNSNSMILLCKNEPEFL